MEREEKRERVDHRQRRAKPQDKPKLDYQRAEVDGIPNVAIPTHNDQFLRRIEMRGRAASTADDVHGALEDDQRAENPKRNREITKNPPIESLCPCGKLIRQVDRKHPVHKSHVENCFKRVHLGLVGADLRVCPDADYFSTYVRLAVELPNELS